MARGSSLKSKVLPGVRHGRALRPMRVSAGDTLAETFLEEVQLEEARVAMGAVSKMARASVSKRHGYCGSTP